MFDSLALLVEHARRGNIPQVILEGLTFLRDNRPLSLIPHNRGTYTVCYVSRIDLDKTATRDFVFDPKEPRAFYALAVTPIFIDGLEYHPTHYRAKDLGSEFPAPEEGKKVTGEQGNMIPDCIKEALKAAGIDLENVIVLKGPPPGGFKHGK
jgi:hypothetical protein